MFDYMTRFFPTNTLEKAPLNQFLLDVWSHLRTLQTWLKIDRTPSIRSGISVADMSCIAEQMPTIGRQLCQRLLSWTGDSQSIATLGPTALSILLGELHLPSAVVQQQIEYVIAAYLSLARTRSPKGMSYSFALRNP